MPAKHRRHYTPETGPVENSEAWGRSQARQRYVAPRDHDGTEWHVHVDNHVQDVGSGDSGQGAAEFGSRAREYYHNDVENNWLRGAGHDGEGAEGKPFFDKMGGDPVEGAGRFHGVSNGRRGGGTGRVSGWTPGEDHGGDAYVNKRPGWADQSSFRGEKSELG